MQTAGSAGRQETKIRLLEVGIELMLERGYQGTGIKEVLERVQVPKGSFYYYFDSKESFCEAALLYYEAQKTCESDQFLENTHYSPLNRLRKNLLHGIGKLEACNFEHGCLLGTLGQELASQSPRLRVVLEGIYQRWIERHMACFESALAAGELPEKTHLPTLVSAYGMMLQGALIQSKITKNANAFNILHDLFFRQIGTPSQPLSPEEEARFSIHAAVEEAGPEPPLAEDLR
ncbi:MAG: TetR family transcriptional regulator C-terminal domain-containing protein [Candidatus Melainabacteria bacterium]|nr:TetR family transcriptional regulator C-terminal domain-containing protein [Candidatus Melainabacteria bacterium]